MQMEIVPAMDEIRGIRLEKALDIVRRIVPLGSVGLLHRMVRPAPGVLMIADIVTEARQAHRILEIVPRHPAHWIQADQAGDNNAQS
jgi:hypothetical protein